MSLKELRQICDNAKPHLLQLPDVREHLLLSKHQKEWNATEQLDFELQSLREGCRQDFSSLDVRTVAAAITCTSEAQQLAVYAENSERLRPAKLRIVLDRLYFQYPVLMWILMRKRPALVFEYVHRDFIFYVTGELPEDSPWHLKIVRWERDGHKADPLLESRAALKYWMFGQIVYLPGEALDPLHADVQREVFGTTAERLDVLDCRRNSYGSPLYEGHDGRVHGTLVNLLSDKADLLLVCCRYIADLTGIVSQLKRKHLVSNYYLLPFAKNYQKVRIRPGKRTAHSFVHFLAHLVDQPETFATYGMKCLVNDTKAQGIKLLVQICREIKKHRKCDQISALICANISKVKGESRRFIIALYLSEDLSIASISAPGDFTPPFEHSLSSNLLKEEAIALLKQILSVHSNSNDLSRQARQVSSLLSPRELLDLPENEKQQLTSFYPSPAVARLSEKCSIDCLLLMSLFSCETSASERRKALALALRPFARELGSEIIVVYNCLKAEGLSLDFCTALVESGAVPRDKLFETAVRTDNVVMLHALFSSGMTTEQIDLLTLTCCKKSKWYMKVLLGE